MTEHVTRCFMCGEAPCRWGGDLGEIEHEALDFERLRTAAEEFVNAAAPLWRIGDGEGGYAFDLIARGVRDRGLHTRARLSPFIDLRSPSTQNAKPPKKQIGRTLRTKVFERDAYRCVVCNAHTDLCPDHIVPESKGGEDTFENLQTLCRSCNSSKGTKDDATWKPQRRAELGIT